MLQKQTAAALSTLARKTVHLAGKFVGHWAVEGAALLIAWRGGKVVRAVTVSLDYLVLGRGAAAAKKQAQALNRAGAAIEVLDEPTFRARFSLTRAEVIALLTGGKAGLDAWYNVSIKGYSIRWPSLAEADLRAMHVPDSVVYCDLERLELDGADFRGARLHNVWFGGMKWAHFDGARFEQCRVRPVGDRCGFVNCSLRNADGSGAWFALLDLHASNFSDATLFKANFRHCRGKDVRFIDADLRGADLANVGLERADFSGADLTGADLCGARLVGARLVGAKLRDAGLTGADLTRADLTDADLRGADLTAADLTRARLHGAALTGAGLRRATVTRQALCHAKRTEGVDPGGPLGPRLQKLDGVARAADLFCLTATLTRAGAPTEVGIFVRQGQEVRAVWGETDSDYRKDSRQFIDAPSLAVVMLSLAHRFRGASFDFDALTVHSKKSRVSGKLLRQLTVDAWREALGS